MFRIKFYESLNIDLEKEFKLLNKKVFNNKIKFDFPIKVINLSDVAGRVEYEIEKNSDNKVTNEKVKELVISDYYDFPKKEIINILLHEMIHILLSQKGIYNDKGGDHGKEFDKEKDRINRDFPEYTIKETQDAKNYEVNK